MRRHERTAHDFRDESTAAPADWEDVRRLLREGPGPCWLSAGAGHRPHVRPVFAAWAFPTEDQFEPTRWQWE